MARFAGNKMKTLMKASMLMGFLSLLAVGAWADPCDLSIDPISGATTKKFEIEVDEKTHFKVVKRLKNSSYIAKTFTSEGLVKNLSENQATVIAENTCNYLAEEIEKQHSKTYVPGSFKCQASAIIVKEGRYEQKEVYNFSPHVMIGSLYMSKYIPGTFLPQTKASYVLLIKEKSPDDVAETQMSKIHSCLASTDPTDRDKIRKLLDLRQQYKSGKAPTAREIADRGFGKPTSDFADTSKLSSSLPLPKGAR